MQALPVPPFTRKKCYRELITRVIKEGHSRWTHRNKQLSESGALTPHLWSPKPRTLVTPPSPHKRKRDVAWSTQRITETNMQKLLHKFTHTVHTITDDIKQTPLLAQGERSGGSVSEEECEGRGKGTWGRERWVRGDPVVCGVQPHSDTGAERGGAKGSGGYVACRVRGTVDLLVPIGVPPVRPPRNKRKLDTNSTQAGHRVGPYVRGKTRLQYM